MFLLGLLEGVVYLFWLQCVSRRGQLQAGLLMRVLRFSGRLEFGSLPDWTAVFVEQVVRRFVGFGWGFIRVGGLFWVGV